MSQEPITLVGGGAAGPDDLRLATGLAPRIAAADGGAAIVLEAGHRPEAVIGDFDSLDVETRARLDRDQLHHVAEQDSTDFEKALIRIEAPLVLAVGFTGARMDHQLAALHGLVRFADRRCVMLGEEEVIFHCPPRLALDLGQDERVSLFPLRPVTGRSTGLRWPIDALDLAPGGRIGTSNMATGGRMTLEADAPGLLVLLPRARLATVTQALLSSEQAPARWPAP